MESFTHINKICINCCGLVGDTLMRVPLIEAVAKRFPCANISVIVDTHREGLLANHPDVDKIFIYNRQKKPRFTYLKKFIHFYWQIRKAKFDLFIDLYGGQISHTLVSFSNARYRIGFYRQAKHARVFDYGELYPVIKGHWSIGLAHILKPLDIEIADIRPGTSFYPTETGKKQATSFMQEINRPYIVFNLGAGRKEKQWPIKSFVELARWLIQHYSYQIIVLKNLGQEYLQDNFIAEFNDKLPNEIKLVNDDSLMNFDFIGALLTKATFMVTADTGIMHIGFGVKTPTVAIFTYERPDWVVAQDYHVDVCFIEDPNHLNEEGFILGNQNIPVRMVQDAIQSLLKRLT